MRSRVKIASARVFIPSASRRAASSVLASPSRRKRAKTLKVRASSTSLPVCSKIARRAGEVLARALRVGAAPAAGGGDLAERAQRDAEVHLAAHGGEEIDGAADALARLREIALQQVRLAEPAQRLGEAELVAELVAELLGLLEHVDGLGGSPHAVVDLAEVGEDERDAVAVADLLGHLERLVEERERAGEVALVLRDGAEVVERGDDADEIADLAADLRAPARTRRARP